MSLVDQLANAIARVESGNFNPSTVAIRNNNPGNLRSWGNYPVVDGYVRFPDYETGMAALRRQVELNIGRGLNLYEFFGGKAGVYPGYAPAGDGNRPRSYAETVAGWLGIGPGVTLNQVGAALPAVAKTSGASFVLPDIQSDVSGVPPAVVAAVVIGSASLLWLAFR